MTKADNLGPLLDLEQAMELEKQDRARPIPGGEPTCPSCGAPMVRRVERHRAPRAGRSPFRVRLVCTAQDCRRWTLYDW